MHASFFEHVAGMKIATLRSQFQLLLRKLLVKNLRSKAGNEINTRKQARKSCMQV